MNRRVPVALIAAAVLATTSALAVSAAGTSSRSNATITTRVIKGGQKTTLHRGTAGGGELAPAVGPEAGTIREAVANRSESSRAKATRIDAGLAGIPVDSSSVTSASGATSFSGINHFQQRFGVANGNQWSLEPPDQALCVGGGYVFEAVNNAVAVYDTSGTLLAADSLNHFFGYPVEIDRSTGIAGPKQTTDPTCLFDPSTNRFFLTILTYDADGAGNPLPSGTNTLDTAVSSSANPIGTWSITHIDATDDGNGGTPSHTNCPCLGDYPHIGVDANGFYVTTNEYPWFVDGFNGSQIYAMSKTELATGASSVTVTQIDTHRADPNGNPGFTVWPAQSPTAAQYDTAKGGTEYFLSTNAAEEANGTGASTELITWSLTNTSSLNTTPRLGFNVVKSTVDKYAVPLPANQKVGSVPLADCLNITACAKIALGTPDKYKETERPLDTLDARMQQVTYANGLLYGSHGTAVDVAGVQKAGIAWYITDPTTDPSNGNLSTTVVHQGKVANAGNNLLMPALGVRPDGSAVIGVTLAGADHYPSAAYVDLSAAGVTGSIKVLAEGVGPEDGFAGYRGFGGRPRWGDYGAAAVDAGGNLWVANEWIAQTCDYATFVSSNFRCGDTRTLLANWSTRISKVAAP
ncbi:MAG TPA: hypothetical protein VHL56_03950 [Candidatus Limnocylindrales bacterium]|nr:hypothetical protein [Candidatus Limnocylindrales bacterium]